MQQVVLYRSQAEAAIDNAMMSGEYLPVFIYIFFTITVFWVLCNYFERKVSYGKNSKFWTIGFAAASMVIGYVALKVFYWLLFNF